MSCYFTMCVSEVAKQGIVFGSVCQYACLCVCTTITEKLLITGFPCLLENPGKFLIYFPKIFRTWKVLENEIGPEKSWKLKCRLLESPGI